MPTSKDWRPTAQIKTLVDRAGLLRTTRQFFAARNIVEVQTSTLAEYGVTDVNIENLTTEGGGVLQSSPEYQMKRLLVAGMPSCYQIGPAYRKGESGRWHSPEFLMLEWYQIGVTLEYLMQEVQELVAVLLKTRPRVVTLSIEQLLKNTYEIDVHTITPNELRAQCQRLGLTGETDEAERLDFLIGSAIAQLDHGLVFLTDYPATMAALAKTKIQNGHEVANRFELVVNGLEIANGYDELLDSEELIRRAECDNALRRQRGLRERQLDPHLVAAMQHGLPDCCGVAVGLDRLIALALHKESLSEVQPFPFRP